MIIHTLKLSPLLLLLLSACDKPGTESANANEHLVAPSAVVELEDETKSSPAEVEGLVETMTTPDTMPANNPVEAPVAANADTDASTVTAQTENKPYQLVDGKISENVMEGWRTYNGGGCGTCHGKGGIGAVGPNLAESLKSKINKETFYELVKNGVPGTMMRPNNTNKRVMDNLDNLYAYLRARSDGVLGPENLIKFPLGKSE